MPSDNAKDTDNVECNEPVVSEVELVPSDDAKDKDDVECNEPVVLAVELVPSDDAKDIGDALGSSAAVKAEATDPDHLILILSDLLMQYREAELVLDSAQD